jgi:hypothetical protein
MILNHLQPQNYWSKPSKFEACLHIASCNLALPNQKLLARHPYCLLATQYSTTISYTQPRNIVKFIHHLFLDHDIAATEFSTDFSCRNRMCSASVRPVLASGLCSTSPQIPKNNKKPQIGFIDADMDAATVIEMSSERLDKKIYRGTWLSGIEGSAGLDLFGRVWQGGR